ncbi:unnamed protein product [Durusdinium trenchii]
MPCPNLWPGRPRHSPELVSHSFAARSTTPQRPPSDEEEETTVGARSSQPGVGFWQSMRNDYSRILEQGRQARAQVRAPHLRASEWLPKEGSSAECAICLANLEVGALVSSLPCSHLFHFECIARWMLQGASMRCSGSCPLCRQQVEESSA